MHEPPTKNLTNVPAAEQSKNTSPSPLRSPVVSSPSPIPKTEAPSTPASPIKSIVRKMLLARPDFPRLYADVVISSAPNSKAAKILRANYQKIIDRINMPIHPNVRSCTHIKVTGVRCGSPSLRGEQFCYFHQRMIRGVRTPPRARIHPMAQLEDGESIQSSLMEVINALMRDSIDAKRAELILRALHIAVKNAHRVRFDLNGSQMVKEVPEYPSTTNVGTAAPGSPGGEAAAPAPAAELEPPYGAAFPTVTTREKDQEIRRIAKAKVERDRQDAIRATLLRASQNVVSGPSQYLKMNKPPASVKEKPPEERKNAAHRASGG